MNHKYFAVLVVIGLAVIVATPALWGANFQGLGDLPGGAFMSEAYGVSGDGSAIVGESTSSDSTRQGFVWTAGSGIVALPFLPGGSGLSDAVRARDASFDGKRIAGATKSTAAGGNWEACVWEFDGTSWNVTGLGFYNTTNKRSLARKISGDGTIIVGESRDGNNADRAVYWQWNGSSWSGPNELPSTSGIRPTYARGINYDGTRVVGMSMFSGVATFTYWTRSGGTWSNATQVEPDSRPDRSVAIHDLSADGFRAVGQREPTVGAARFHNWTGSTFGHGQRPGTSTNRSACYGATGDGLFTIVGRGLEDGTQVAFIWSGAHGGGLRLCLRTVLQNDHSLNLDGWTLTSAEAISDDGNVIVGYGNNPQGQNEAWMVSFGQAPTIETQPISQTVCDGQTATFTVVADGTPPLRYQWYDAADDEPIDNATGASYETGVAGSYYCIVSNDLDDATSNTVTLTVIALPTINDDPASQEVIEGAEVTFSVTASGDDLSYQWRKDEADILDANSSSYTITSAGLGDAGDYDCVVSNICDEVTSAAATLTVNVLPIGEAKKNANGVKVSLSNKAVSAVFSDHFYVQDDSSSGIRVVIAPMPAGLEVGKSVILQGTLATTSDGERVVEATSVEVSEGEAPAPYGVTNKELGGGDYHYNPANGAGQRGVEDGTGLNTIGLLVKTTGTVTAVGEDYFYINDGTEAIDFSLFRGVRVRCGGLDKPESGDYVSVTGISSIINVEDRFFRSITPRTGADLQSVDP